MFNILSKAVVDTTKIAETTTQATGDMALRFSMDNIGEALLWSVAGMIGIFIVIGIIILSVSILNKVGNGKKKK